MKVEERPVRLQELLVAKEVFITSTTKGIWTVGNMDGHPIGDGKPGEFSAKLYEKLLEEMNIMTS
jgi:branched-subunit amino acid aminotransferase/4-amino-4-deoxychorismate lyase